MEKFFLVIVTLGTAAIIFTAAYFGVLLWVLLGYGVGGIALIVKALISKNPEWSEEDDAQFEWIKQQAKS